MNRFTSINPHDGREIAAYQEQSHADTDAALQRADKAFGEWRTVSIEDRSRLIERASQVLTGRAEELARLITLEMGKPITESLAEVAKCASVCTYYAEHAAEFLTPEVIPTEARESFVRHDPIGCVLAIMPWNFPLWQVFRFAAPTLVAGNTTVLKHAPNVFGCARSIEAVFREAGFPPGVFQNLIIHHNRTEEVVSHHAVKALALTGSEQAGRAVAEISGRHLKKCVLELGGSNPFVVWEDADIEHAVKVAVSSRMLNGGQSCIAAKRFILVEKIHDEFVTRFTEAVGRLKLGDPLDTTTQMGPMARRDLADQLQNQVQATIRSGAKLLLGGKQHDCYHEPTVLAEVTAEMPAFSEETFGPLAAMVRAKDADEAFQLAERSRYGLGVTLCTSDLERARAFAEKVGDGSCFVNELVKSDPRLPFGGTKSSGYGRELSRDGLLEFVNRKTVYIK